MKTILITGISGFVGSNLTSYLWQHTDYKILGSSRHEHFSVQGKEIEIIKNDSKQWNDHQVDVVIHLAGIAHDLSGKFQTDDYERVNVEGTRQVVDEFLQSAASVFIFVSSIKAVADHSVEVLDELVVPNPKSDYGKSKLKAEQYIESRLNNSKKRFYILRPAMMHGSGNKGNLNLLYRFVKKGFPFPFGKFHNQRSFLSIENFSFVVRALMEKPVLSGVYHVADDGALSTGELYGLIADTLGKKKRVWNVPGGLLKSLAALLGKKQMVDKLTESMIVSNKKLCQTLDTQLPIEIKEGLQKTIRSFHG